MRGVLKRATEVVLLHAGPAHAARRAVADRVLVLAYHGVVPHGERVRGERSLHLPQAAFAAQLDELGRRCDVVSLAEAFDRPARRGRARAVITFDDAYLGAVTAGVEELTRRGMPATIFVATGFVGGREFWWDALADDGGAVPPEIRAHALENGRGEDLQVRAWARATGLPLCEGLPAYARAATLDDLARATAQAGITLGSHTVTHPNLTRLDSAALARELGESRAWLEVHFSGKVVPWLAYPYGLTSAEVMRAAAGAGYLGAFRVAGGWLPRGAQPGFDLPRLNVPAGISREGFALRAAGLLAR